MPNQENIIGQMVLTKVYRLFNKGAKAGDTDSANVIFEQAIDKFNNAIACQNQIQQILIKIWLMLT